MGTYASLTIMRKLTPIVVRESSRQFLEKNLWLTTERDLCLKSKMSEKVQIIESGKNVSCYSDKPLGLESEKDMSPD